MGEEGGGVNGREKGHLPSSVLSVSVNESRLILGSLKRHAKMEVKETKNVISTDRPEAIPVNNQPEEAFPAGPP